MPQIRCLWWQWMANGVYLFVIFGMGSTISMNKGQ